MKLYTDLTDDTDKNGLFDGFFRENPRNQCNPCTDLNRLSRCQMNPCDHTADGAASQFDGGNMQWH